MGNGNNRHFHNAAKAREIRNAIRDIQRGDRSMADTQEDIKIEAVNYFNSFLSHEIPDYQVYRWRP